MSKLQALSQAMVPVFDTVNSAAVNTQHLLCRDIMTDTYNELQAEWDYIEAMLEKAMSNVRVLRKQLQVALNTGNSELVSIFIKEHKDEGSLLMERMSMHLTTLLARTPSLSGAIFRTLLFACQWHLLKQMSRSNLTV